MVGPADLAYVETWSQDALSRAARAVDFEVQRLLADPEYQTEMPALSALASTESKWERVTQLTFTTKGRLADAYRDREADNLMLLEELGPTHWSTLNNDLELAVKAAEAAVADVQNQINELNAQRQENHKQAWEKISYLDERWRFKARAIVDTFVYNADK